MSGTWLSPDSLRSLADWLDEAEDTQARNLFLRSCGALQEDVPLLSAAYRLGGLVALGDTHGRLFGERGWSFLKAGSRHRST